MATENVNDFNSYITRWLRPQQGEIFGLPETPEFESEMWDRPTGPQFVPPIVHPPRVVPPEGRRDTRKPMAWDGGPGLRDGKHASRIKYLLRDES